MTFDRRITAVDIHADGMPGRVITGGVGEGWGVRSTIIADAPADARVVKEEIFGPVTVATRFDTEAEAVTLANDTRYGLTAGVYTRDVAETRQRQTLKLAEQEQYPLQVSIEPEGASA